MKENMEFVTIEKVVEENEEGVVESNHISFDIWLDPFTIHG